MTLAALAKSFFFLVTSHFVTRPLYSVGLSVNVPLETLSASSAFSSSMIRIVEAAAVFLEEHLIIFYI